MSDKKIKLFDCVEFLLKVRKRLVRKGYNPPEFTDFGDPVKAASKFIEKLVDMRETEMRVEFLKERLIEAQCEHIRVLDVLRKGGMISDSEVAAFDQRILDELRRVTEGGRE